MFLFARGRWMGVCGGAMFEVHVGDIGKVCVDVDGL